MSLFNLGKRKKEAKRYNIDTTEGVIEFANNQEGNIASTALMLLCKAVTELMEIRTLLERDRRQP